MRPWSREKVKREIIIEIFSLLNGASGRDSRVYFRLRARWKLREHTNRQDWRKMRQGEKEIQITSRHTPFDNWFDYGN